MLLTKQVITVENFRRRTAPLLGLPVSYTWRGYGSAIFLELGKLTRTEGDEHPRGEFHLMIQWSWRIEGPASIRAGSWSTDRRITFAVADLQKRRVEAIELSGRLPELTLQLSGQQWLQTFMTAEGQPAWTVFLKRHNWISVERGRLVHEHRTGR